MVIKNKEPELWGSPDQEVLTASDPDEAIENLLDEMEPPYPEKITICGYSRMEMDTSRLNPLEHVLEYLDEEYGDPDGDPTKETEAMKAAEQVFLEAIKKEYTAWGCQRVSQEEVVVADWIKANRPDWLEGDTHGNPA